MSNESQTPRPAALVTGASGGVGRAVALDLARAGFDVALQYGQNAEAAEATASAARAFGAHASVLPAELTEAGACEALVAAAHGTLGRLDALVHAAGHFVEKPLAFTSAEELGDLLDVHAIAAAMLAREALRYLRKSPQGRIVFVGSVAGKIGLGNAAAYAAAKGTLEGLTRSLALEVARWGVTVNTVAPGYIATAMTAHHDDERRAQAAAAIPLGRYALPEEIAAPVAFLCSPGAAYLTGQSLTVDGGLSLG